MKFIVVLALLSLAACGHDEPLPSCSGPIFQLNTGRWTATAADLRTPPAIRPGQ